jgi:protein-disulfide isomerase
MNVQRLTIITAVVFVLAIFGFVIVNRARPASAGQTTAAGASATTPDPSKLSYEGQPAIGNPNAPVKIALFEDFKCPACKYFDENVWPKLENEYVSTNQVQVYFINYAFLAPDSRTAAVAAECVYRQDETLFWQYKEIVYRSQGPESQAWATPARLTELAREYVPDINADELRTCIDENRYEAEVTADVQMGVTVGVRGTPSVFVNGTQVETANDYTQLKALIDEALASTRSEETSN